VEAEAFTEAMGSLTVTVASEAVRLINTQCVPLAADISGAGGALLYALLDANPTLRGIVFDLSNIVPPIGSLRSRMPREQDRVHA